MSGVGSHPASASAASGAGSASFSPSSSLVPANSNNTNSTSTNAAVANSGGSGTAAGAGGSPSQPPVPIALQHVFGLKGDVKNNIHYLDDTHVLYPAGYSIVLYNTERKTQKFISLGSPDFVSSCDISALAFLSPSAPQVSHSALSVASAAAAAAAAGGAGGALQQQGQHAGSRLLAVAERGEPQKAVITVFELSSLKRRSKYLLQAPEVTSREFVSVAFSSDCRYLLAQGGAPDWTLVNFNIERGRVLQMARVSNQAGAAIHQVRTVVMPAFTSSRSA